MCVCVYVCVCTPHVYMCAHICVCMGFPGGSVVKIPPANAGDIEGLGLIPGWGRSPGEGNGNPLQYSCLENSMDGETWWATVHGVAKSPMWVSDFTFTNIKILLLKVAIIKTIIQKTRKGKINILIATHWTKGKKEMDRHFQQHIYQLFAPHWAFGLCIYGSSGAVAAVGL